MSRHKVHLEAVILWAMLISGVVGHLIVQLAHDSIKPEWFAATLHFACDALVVAGLLGLTVDWYLKRKLLQDVAEVIFGFALPQELRTAIRDVTKTSIVFRNMRANYTLSIDGTEVIAKIAQSWDVFNYGSATVDYQTKLADDLHEKPNPQAVECSLISNTITKHYSFSDPSVMKKHSDEVNEAIVYRSDEIKLPPQNGNDTRPGCQVSWRSELRMPLHYSTVLSLSRATIGVVISCVCPDTIRFDCDTNEQSKHAKGSKEWHRPELFMPGQVIRVRWKPIATPDCSEN